MEISGCIYNMNNVIILCWQPGSGGDTVQRLLGTDPKFKTVVEKFNLTKAGRTQPCINPWFKDNFSHTPGQWLWRSWSNDDLELLHTWPNLQAFQTLILPTHSADQARWLKNNLSGSIVVGITYSESMFYCVLNNWCTKIALDDPEVMKNYNSKVHQYLDKKGHLGTVIFKDQLVFGSNIPTSALPEWDINISLEKLLIGDIAILKQIDLDTTLCQPVLDQWMQKQKKLFKNQWSICDQLKQALGHNTFAPLQYNTADINLDYYDKILLRSWCRRNQIPVPNEPIDTLAMADLWFKKSLAAIYNDKQ